MMVTQFRDNPFEKQFYEFDKEMAISEYKRVYLIPEIESKLSFILTNRVHWHNSSNGEVVAAMDLVRDELKSELRLVGEDKFAAVDSITVGTFDSLIHRKTVNFLSALKRYYATKKDKAQQSKEELVEFLTNTPEKSAAFEAFRVKYENQVVSDAVKNLTTPERIIEYRNQLYQKIYPIFQDDHRPRHPLDFSASLYQPTKHLAGSTHDTFIFNVLVIWSMTVFLFVTLYFDLLHRLVMRIENWVKYSKKRGRD